MSRKPRSYSADFKQEAVRRMAQATSIVDLAKQLGIRRKLLYQWRDQCGQEAGLGWSDAEADRQEVSRKLFYRRDPMPPNCGLLSWNDCSAASNWRWIF